eukprot:TRINITY_DN13809_c0_g1_i10.p1 TRINITY_DN13809_c0_g1~~TRINITY_DN13809_c0_g1_i10.p1  ORF type:complete len:1514 (+),score=456.94 TRINITY_DN13809_c0_g1_i10:125-4666(+)
MALEDEVLYGVGAVAILSLVSVLGLGLYLQASLKALAARLDNETVVRREVVEFLGIGRDWHIHGRPKFLTQVEVEVNTIVQNVLVHYASKAEIAKLQEELRVTKEALDSKIGKEEDLECRMTQLELDVELRLEALESKIAKVREDLEHRMRQLEGDVEQLQTAISRLEDDVRRLRWDLSDLQDQIGRLEEKLNVLRARIDGIEKDLVLTKEKLKTMTIDVNVLRARIDGIEKDLVLTKEVLKKLQKQLLEERRRAVEEEQQLLRTIKAGDAALRRRIDKRQQNGICQEELVEAARRLKADGRRIRVMLKEIMTKMMGLFHQHLEAVAEAERAAAKTQAAPELDGLQLAQLIEAASEEELTCFLESLPPELLERAHAALNSTEDEAVADGLHAAADPAFDAQRLTHLIETASQDEVTWFLKSLPPELLERAHAALTSTQDEAVADGLHAAADLASDAQRLAHLIETASQDEVTCFLQGLPLGLLQCARAAVTDDEAAAMRPVLGLDIPELAALIDRAKESEMTSFLEGLAPETLDNLQAAFLADDEAELDTLFKGMSELLEKMLQQSLECITKAKSALDLAEKTKAAQAACHEQQIKSLIKTRQELADEVDAKVRAKVQAESRRQEDYFVTLLNLTVREAQEDLSTRLGSEIHEVHLELLEGLNAKTADLQADISRWTSEVGEAREETSAAATRLEAVVRKIRVALKEILGNLLTLFQQHLEADVESGHATGTKLLDGHTLPHLVRTASGDELTSFAQGLPQELLDRCAALITEQAAADGAQAGADGQPAPVLDRHQLAEVISSASEDQLSSFLQSLRPDLLNICREAVKEEEEAAADGAQAGADGQPAPVLDRHQLAEVISSASEDQLSSFLQSLRPDLLNICREAVKEEEEADLDVLLDRVSELTEKLLQRHMEGLTKARSALKVAKQTKSAQGQLDENLKKNQKVLDAVVKQQAEEMTKLQDELASERKHRHAAFIVLQHTLVAQTSRLEALDELNKQQEEKMTKLQDELASERKHRHAAFIVLQHTLVAQKSKQAALDDLVKKQEEMTRLQDELASERKHRHAAFIVLQHTLVAQTSRLEALDEFNKQQEEEMTKLQDELASEKSKQAALDDLVKKQEEMTSRLEALDEFNKQQEEEMTSTQKALESLWELQLPRSEGQDTKTRQPPLGALGTSLRNLEAELEEELQKSSQRVLTAKDAMQGFLEEELAKARQAALDAQQKQASAIKELEEGLEKSRQAALEAKQKQASAIKKLEEELETSRQAALEAKQKQASAIKKLEEELAKSRQAALEAKQKQTALAAELEVEMMEQRDSVRRCLAELDLPRQKFDAAQLDCDVQIKRLENARRQAQRSHRQAQTLTEGIQSFYEDIQKIKATLEDAFMDSEDDNSKADAGAHDRARRRAFWKKELKAVKDDVAAVRSKVGSLEHRSSRLEHFRADTEGAMQAEWHSRGFQVPGAPSFKYFNMHRTGDDYTKRKLRGSAAGILRPGTPGPSRVRETSAGNFHRVTP